MRLYKEYIKEREDLELIESNNGFITYRIESDHVFIANIFVSKNSRNSGEARELAEQVHELAEGKVFCGVCTEANNWEESLKFIKYMGYRETHREYTMIFLVKEK